jgi:hypothetical protein
LPKRFPKVPHALVYEQGHLQFHRLSIYNA